MFSRILIANRGEIACRVIRTAKRLGIATVAVYSSADERALHVQLADEAVAIGPAPARDSYLCVEALLAAARRTGAEAVHPGYGFLSEYAHFAEACAGAGLVFIGPPPAAIRAMGSKSAAKALMAAAGIPVVPGYHGEDQSEERLTREAVRIGYPVMLKAVAGGGGKGMRRVDAPAGLASALAAARREARAAFGDEGMLVEKCLDNPRHLEVQVFGDTHGGLVHLYERDCSVQRRHQKIVEEAPAPGLSAEQRAELGRMAVAAANAVGYVGAGTVEFIADQDGHCYFMEMNTRLQVEHPVTECITGLDLVEWQLRVATGEPLPLGQAQIRRAGHALEMRLCAEDAARDFLPATGRLHHLRFPAEGPAVRVDTGVQVGDAVTIHYDSLLAKLIVHGPDRRTVLERARAVLRDTELVGVRSNRDFLAALIAHPAFASGTVDTGFIERHRQELLQPAPAVPDAAAILALAAAAWQRSRAQQLAAVSADPHSPWHDTGGWRPNLESEGSLTVPAVFEDDGVTLAATIDGRQRRITVVSDGETVTLLESGCCSSLPHPGSATLDAARTVAPGGLRAPMPGRVVAVHTMPGATVRRGEILLVLEAMKMEHAISAPADGIVARVHFAAGDLVDEGVELLSMAEPG
ncbi:MAG: biotin carboxylase N-terminal domain-containing protein [Gammaproteobacteria bacterium]